MRKLFVGIVRLLSAFIAVQAQEANDFEATNNVVKLNFGPGLVFSDIYEYDFPKTICHKTSISLDLSLGYAHTFNSGLGFGLNFIQSHLNALAKMIIMPVPAFTMVLLSITAGILTSRWVWDMQETTMASKAARTVLVCSSK